MLVDERGKDVPVKTVDNKDGTFTVEYEPTTVGMYTVQVYFAEKEIPKSPIKVKVESSIDLSKVTVKGLDTRKLICVNHLVCCNGMFYEITWCFLLVDWNLLVTKQCWVDPLHFSLLMPKIICGQQILW